MKPIASAPVSGTKNYYQMLKCYDYDDRPIIKTPIAKIKNDR